jgi:hypothetical protein
MATTITLIGEADCCLNTLRETVIKNFKNENK